MTSTLYLHGMADLLSIYVFRLHPYFHCSLPLGNRQDLIGKSSPADRSSYLDGRLEREGGGFAIPCTEEAPSSKQVPDSDCSLAILTSPSPPLLAGPYPCLLHRSSSSPSSQ